MSDSEQLQRRGTLQPNLAEIDAGKRAGYEVVEMAVLNHWKWLPEERRRLLVEAVARQEAEETP